LWAQLIVSGCVGIPRENLGLIGDSVVVSVIIVIFVIVSCCVLIGLLLELCSMALFEAGMKAEEGISLCVADFHLTANGSWQAAINHGGCCRYWLGVLVLFVHSKIIFYCAVY